MCQLRSRWTRAKTVTPFGGVGGVNCNPLNPNPQEYLRPKRRKISQRKQVYNMHAVHNQISEEII